MNKILQSCPENSEKLCFKFVLLFYALQSRGRIRIIFFILLFAVSVPFLSNWFESTTLITYHIFGFGSKQIMHFLNEDFSFFNL